MTSVYTAPPESVEAARETSPVSANFRPSCPGLYATSLVQEHDEVMYTPAQCKKLDFKVECHLSTAFVTAKATWVVPGALLKSKKNDANKGAITFAVPISAKATVTGVSATMKKKRITSAVVPTADTGNFKGTRFGRNTPEPLPVHPEIFAISLPGVPSGETVEIEVNYFHPLDFMDGAYMFKAPTTLPMGSVSSGTPLTKVLSLMATVRSAYPGEVAVSSTTHPLAFVQKGSGVTQVQLDPIKSEHWRNQDFVLKMPVWGGDIAAAGVQQPAPPENKDQRTAFAVAIAPPKPELVNPFPRDVVFLLDRSGSMAGSIIGGARNAIVAGLRDLSPADRFNICAFDNLQTYFSDEGLVQATPDALMSAYKWVHEHCTARGTTDIMTPLRESLEMIAKTGSQGNVPFVFVITDGAVSDERDICNFMKSYAAKADASKVPRVCTFGIGKYANHYFLKMLASIGRGHNGETFVAHTVQRDMMELLQRCKVPILTDIAVGLPSQMGAEVYPFPIPDLFAGAPVMISGKISGGLPPQVDIVGKLADGSEWRRTIPVATDLQNNVGSIPLEKVFIKQRIDIMTAKAWLTEEKVLEQQVKAMSLEHGVPSVHTKLCAFEINPKKEAEMRQSQKSGGGAMNVAKYAAGGAAGVMVLGALAGASFGDVGASMSNAAAILPGAGAMLASIDFGDIDVPDLGCLADVVESVPCGECLEPVLEFVEPCVENIGECAEGIAECVGGLAECVKDML